MTVAELIEALKNFPQDMEVVCDYDSGYSTGSIDIIKIGNKYYDEDCEEVVILE